VSDLSTQITMGNADFNVVIEDRRNIVEISREEPNIVQVKLPGGSSGTQTLFGEGVPWEIEVEV